MVVNLVAYSVEMPVVEMVVLMVGYLAEDLVGWKAD